MTDNQGNPLAVAVARQRRRNKQAEQSRREQAEREERRWQAKQGSVLFASSTTIKHEFHDGESCFPGCPAYRSPR